MKHHLSSIVSAGILLLAALGEVNQRMKGYSFNYSQLFDVRLHHEHLIVAFLVFGVLFDEFCHLYQRMKKRR